MTAINKDLSKLRELKFSRELSLWEKSKFGGPHFRNERDVIRYSTISFTSTKYCKLLSLKMDRMINIFEDIDLTDSEKYKELGDLKSQMFWSRECIRQIITLIMVCNASDSMKYQFANSCDFCGHPYKDHDYSCNCPPY